MNILTFRKLISSEFQTGSLYVLPTKSNSLFWNGMIVIRSGVYKNAILRFTVQLESSFPNQKTPPVLKMLSMPLEHPLISPDTFVFDSSHAFPSWSDSEHLYTLMKYFKYCLENFEFCCSLPTGSIVNMDIVDIYTKDKEEFQRKTQQAVTSSVNEIFNEVGSENCFSFDRSVLEEDTEIHQSILENMKNLVEQPESFSFLHDRRGVN